MTPTPKMPKLRIHSAKCLPAAHSLPILHTARSDLIDHTHLCFCFKELKCCETFNSAFTGLKPSYHKRVVNSCHHRSSRRTRRNGETFDDKTDGAYQIVKEVK